MRISMAKKAGKISTNFLKAILIAISVLSRLAIDETSNVTPVIAYKLNIFKMSQPYRILLRYHTYLSLLK